MSEHEWNVMNDSDFEAMLTQSVSELPPDDVAAGVTPWKKAMSRILFGLALNTITIRFFDLNYILPAIGMVLLLLGFRTLRRENGWFASCFVIAVLRSADFFADLILNTTIYKSEILPPDVETVLTAASVVLLLIQLLCFRRGLCAVKRKAGLPPKAGAAFALFVWYVLGVLAALAQLEGLIIVGVLLISYILIIVSLCKLSTVLDEAGYTVRPAAVKVTDLCIVLVLAAALLLGGAAGYIFGGSYEMNWIAEEPAVQDKTQEIKAKLVELGFPEDVLNDLTEEDIAACEGAQLVLVEVNDKSESASDETLDMIITNIAVHVPGEADEWVVFHRFVWKSNPGFIGTESLQLYPAWTFDEDELSSGGKVTGHVQYDKDGRTYTAPYYRLEQETYTSPNLFSRTETRTTYFADFTMPNDGEHCRGYVAYPLYGELRDSAATSYIMYTHQQSRWQYPVLTARQSHISGTEFIDDAFFTVIDMIQFHLTADGGYSAS